MDSPSYHKSADQQQLDLLKVLEDSWVKLIQFSLFINHQITMKVILSLFTVFKV